MKKFASLLMAALLMVAMALPASAVDFTPSVQQKPAPSVETVTDASGNEVSAIIQDASGNEVHGVTADQMSITPVSGAANAPAEIREQLEAAYEQIQNAASVADLVPDVDVASLLSAMGSSSSVEDLVVRDVFDVSVSGEAAEFLAQEGNAITIRFQLNIAPSSTLLVLHNYEGSNWEVIDDDKVVINNDGSPGIYNLDATPYESIMLGLFSVWQGPENDVCAADNVIKRNQIMLGYSRDGYSWLREDMNPFLPVDENRSAWNNGNLQSVVGSPLIVGDELYFYLSGRRLQGTQEITTTGLATLRRDGFASMSGSGELTTPVLKFDGEYFFVNADLTGELRVELLDEDGNVLSGFSKDDCTPLTGDGTMLPVRWAANTTLASLQGQNIKVRFYLEGGDLYAFWISPDADGASHGYTGGGGPGLDASGLDISNN